jgi:hypothetical protein
MDTTASDAIEELERLVEIEEADYRLKSSIPPLLHLQCLACSATRKKRALSFCR